MRERLTKVIAANTWVAGRIVRKPGEKLLQLLSPAAGETVSDDVMDELVRVNPDDFPQISPNMDYDALSKAILGSSAPASQLPLFAYTSPFYQLCGRAVADYSNNPCV